MYQEAEPHGRIARHIAGLYGNGDVGAQKTVFNLKEVITVFRPHVGVHKQKVIDAQESSDDGRMNEKTGNGINGGVTCGLLLGGTDIYVAIYIDLRFAKRDFLRQGDSNAETSNVRIRSNRSGSRKSKTVALGLEGNGTLVIRWFPCIN